ncbi:hypothetical protein CIW48_26210 [Methylobacterium sp. P1-11]|uniref:hypothetical protein n=1 Tax=Methylobacterium sp. P1-11 TaxID=2024616 RepID=UPI0011ECFB09|nr:hypothetical protein [Methylobacterium sp. P1-11]KAA0121003.1 hypothetical protein CIW48_26210 [Methylobacterium sp. P1-11]
MEVTIDTAAIAQLARDLAAFGPKLPNAQALVLVLVLNRVGTPAAPANHSAGTAHRVREGFDCPFAG